MDNFKIKGLNKSNPSVGDSIDAVFVPSLVVIQGNGVCSDLKGSKPS